MTRPREASSLCVFLCIAAAHSDASGSARALLGGYTFYGGYDYEDAANAPTIEEGTFLSYVFGLWYVVSWCAMGYCDLDGLSA